MANKIGEFTTGDFVEYANSENFWIVKVVQDISSQEFSGITTNCDNRLNRQIGYFDASLGKSYFRKIDNNQTVDNMNPNKPGDFKDGDIVEYCYPGKPTNQELIILVENLNNNIFGGKVLKCTNAGNVALNVSMPAQWEARWFRKVENPLDYVSKPVIIPTGWRKMERTETVEKGDMYWKPAKINFVPCVGSIGRLVGQAFKDVATVVTTRPKAAPKVAGVTGTPTPVTPADKSVTVNAIWLLNMVNEGAICPRSSGQSQYSGKSIYLEENNFHWKLARDNAGYLCLIPTLK